MELKIPQVDPKIDNLANMVHRPKGGKLYSRDTSTIFQSLSHLAVLATGSLKDQWCNLARSHAIKPWRVPEGAPLPITMVMMVEA